MKTTKSINKQIKELSIVAKTFYDKNWLLGTSGNLSFLSSRTPLCFFITMKGTEKEALSSESFIEAEVIDNDTVAKKGINNNKLSGETELHTTIYQNTLAGAVIHTHSAHALAIADLFSNKGYFVFKGYEIQKGFGFKEIGRICRIPVFKNSNNLAKLSRNIINKVTPDQFGFLIEKHGLFVWGKTVKDAKRHTELLHHMFEYILLRQ